MPVNTRKALDSAGNFTYEVASDLAGKASAPGDALHGLRSACAAPPRAERFDARGVCEGTRCDRRDAKRLGERSSPSVKSQRKRLLKLATKARLQAPLVPSSPGPGKEQ